MLFLGWIFTDQTQDEGLRWRRRRCFVDEPSPDREALQQKEETGSQTEEEARVCKTEIGNTTHRESILKFPAYFYGIFLGLDNNVTKLT